MTYVTWDGVPLPSQTLELTLTGKFDPAALQGDLTRVVYADREVIIMLARGQKWLAAGPKYRRGQPVTLTIGGEPFEGRVRFRRLNKLVLTGHFAPIGH